MKLDDIQQLWEQDVKIDRTELGEESIKIPQLHSKYFKLYSNERLTLKKLEGDYKQLYKVKYEYYSGNLSEEELTERNWEPMQLRILKADIPMYIEADGDIITLAHKVQLQEQKVEFLESIIKSLTNRGFQIKAAIEWTKFTQGT